MLPHPGGGGERYADLLERMPGFRFSRFFLAASASAGSAEAVRRALGGMRVAARYDLVHVHGEVAAALCLPTLATRPSVVTLHGLHLVRRLTGMRRRWAAASLRLVVRAAGRTICVSAHEQEELVAAVGRRTARRADVVRNGIELPPAPSASERAAVRAELGLSASEPVAIWVGSLDEHKDPLTAVRAAIQANLSLLVVGDGPLRPDLEACAGEHVRLLGRRPDVDRLLPAADFFVLTSSREGLSFSLLEAMALGLPPVVSDLAENLEAIGEAGISTPVGDVASLVAAFRRLARDERGRRALGELARRRAGECFRADEMVGRTREIYEGVLDERQPRRRPRPTAQ